MLKWGSLALAAALIVLTGCPPPRAPGVAPRDEQEAVGRINDNIARINAPVQYNGYASFRFRDSKGKDRRVLPQEAVLIYKQARDLRFEVRSISGTVAQIGSNEERFWIWIEPEVRKLWWGSWASLGASGARQLPIPPQDLIYSLMLHPLPATQADGKPPRLRHTGKTYHLVYERPGGSRDIVLDPRPPYQPTEILDRRADGQIQMRAVLENYRVMENEGPYTPRRYVIYWPLDQAEMRLDVRRAVFRPDLPPEAFAFPSGWQGETEELDVAQQ